MIWVSLFFLLTSTILATHSFKEDDIHWGYLWVIAGLLHLFSVSMRLL